MAPDWMNWTGWHWIGLIGALIEGVILGWYCRGVWDRSQAFRARYGEALMHTSLARKVQIALLAIVSAVCVVLAAYIDWSAYP